MTSLKGRTVLVVDDEPGFREVLEDEFRMAGAEVLTADNGSNAFTLTQTRPVDFVVSDVRMPGGDGVQLLDRLKAERERLPVAMMITGFSDLATEDAYDKGAQAVFSKPFDLDLLIESAHRALLPETQRWQGETTGRQATEVTLAYSSLEKAIEANAIRIGYGGVFVAHASYALQPGAIVRLQVRGFDGLGICRWVRYSGTPDLPAGFGLEFSCLTQPSQEVLQATLEKQPTRSYIPNGRTRRSA